MYYSSTAKTTYTAVVQVERERWNHHGSWQLKCETRQTPRATNTLDHPPTQPPTDRTHPHTDPTTHRRTNLPTHDVLHTAIQQSTAGDALMMIQTELQWHWDFHVFTIIRHPGERADPSPGGPRWPSRPSAPFLSPAHRWAVVWEGRGVEWPRYTERERTDRCWLGGQLLFFWGHFSCIKPQMRGRNGGKAAEWAYGGISQGAKSTLPIPTCLR